MPESILATERLACREVAQPSPVEVAPQPIAVVAATVEGPDGAIEMRVLSDFADRSDGAARVLMRFACAGPRRRGVVTVTTPRPMPINTKPLRRRAPRSPRAAGGSAVALVAVEADPAG
jgi:hypothetical protein